MTLTTRQTKYVGKGLPEEAANEAIRRYCEFALKVGGQQGRGNHPCLTAVAKRRAIACRNRYSDRSYGTCHLPGFDHTSYWIRDGRPTVLVTQPYDHLTEIEFRERWGERTKALGLRMLVSRDLSWHYPGATVLVAFWPDEHDLFIR